MSILGSLGSHKPSHHGEYSFGQKPKADDSTVRVEAAPPADDEDDILKIKPANERDVKSWSADETSDILFWELSLFILYLTDMNYYAVK